MKLSTSRQKQFICSLRSTRWTKKKRLCWMCLPAVQHKCQLLGINPTHLKNMFISREFRWRYEREQQWIERSLLTCNNQFARRNYKPWNIILHENWSYSTKLSYHRLNRSRLFALYGTKAKADGKPTHNITCPLSEKLR